MSQDNVNHPQHYGGDTPYETIKVLESWLTPAEYAGFLKGNTIKYLSRAGKKDKTLQDLEKAQWYLKEWIRQESPAPADEPVLFSGLVDENRVRQLMEEFMKQHLKSK